MKNSGKSPSIWKKLPKGRNKVAENVLIVRPAEEEDVENIFLLLDEYAREKLLLARSWEDILFHRKNFRVGVHKESGEFLCCLALRDYGENLYEIRSLAVKKSCVNGGIGSMLVEGAVEDLQKKGEKCRVFALTYRAPFFCRLGFKIVGKELFPQKIWSDCAKCPKQKNCDETAVLREL